MITPEIDKLFTYHDPTEASIIYLKNVRESAKSLANVINENIPECADKSAAIRKLRECVMTANTAILLNQS